jgi:hypothetical protein
MTTKGLKKSQSLGTSKVPRKVDPGNLLATKRRKRRKNSEDQKPFRVFSCLFAAKFSGDCLTDGHKKAQKSQKFGELKPFSCLFVPLRGQISRPD